LGNENFLEGVMEGVLDDARADGRGDCAGDGYGVVPNNAGCASRCFVSIPERLDS